MSKPKEVLLNLREQFGLKSSFLLLLALLCFAFGLAKEWYALVLVPFLPFIFYLFFYQPYYLFMGVAFLVPLSIDVDIEGLGAGISLPTEPILIGLTVLMIFRFFYDLDWKDKRFTHPLSIIIALQLLWMFITVFTSTMFIVSLKSFLAQLWFTVGAYYMGLFYFDKIANIKRVFCFMFVPLAFVVIYALVNHQQYFFSLESSSRVVKPFFIDHTIYGVYLALMLPLILVMVFARNTFKLNNLEVTGLLVVLFILVVGTVFSYTRAAWLSLICSFGFWLLMLIRIRLRFIVLGIALIASLFVYFSAEIGVFLSRNKHTSSSGFEQHLKSMYNVSTDASNTERINRWTSAIRMAQDKPVFGFGPGTYMFQYAPYQLSSELTIISTHTGSVGNAHSEYFTALSERGWPGLILFSIFVLYFFHRGMHLYYKAENPQVRYLALACVLSLVSYFTHGFINNFLDTDKASIPVWMLLSIIVALDIFHHPKPKKIAS